MYSGEDSRPLESGLRGRLNVTSDLPDQSDSRIIALPMKAPHLPLIGVTCIVLDFTALAFASSGTMPVDSDLASRRSAAMWMLYLVASVLIIFLVAVAFFAAMRAGRRRREREARANAAVAGAPGPPDPWSESGKRMRERAGKMYQHDDDDNDESENDHHSHDDDDDDDDNVSFR
jgi:hypothetical protein